MELLKVEPKFLSESPELRKLINTTYIPQTALSLALVGAWFLGLRWSKSWGMGFVPSQFLTKIDRVIASHGTSWFEPGVRDLMKHRHGRRGSSDMDLLVRTILDDANRRQSLYFCLDRSGMSVAKRYLVMRRNEAAFWSLWIWVAYFFYAHLLLSFLVFPAGRWVPGALAFLLTSSVLKALAAIGTLLTFVRTIFTSIRSLTRERTTR